LWNGHVLGFSKQEPLRKISVMALKIRLTRVGAVHQPHYRVVVAEARSRRDGDPVEVIGTYDPRTKGQQVKLKLDRVDYWLSKGAKPSDTLHAIIKRARRAPVAAAATA
jgi:small subunit ribosomal protein S16